MIKLVLIQGANMEWLGRRQPELYGTTTTAELDAMLLDEAKARGVELQILYTNVEGEAISLINPAGFLYSGYALRDCLRSITLPAIEIHITNIEKRGMHSVTAEAAIGYVAGFGLDSYFVALDAMLRHLKRAKG
jgi:3-dehydroquinate dehydratase-2